MMSQMNGPTLPACWSWSVLMCLIYHLSRMRARAPGRAAGRGIGCAHRWASDGGGGPAPAAARTATRFAAALGAGVGDGRLAGLCAGGVGVGIRVRGARWAGARGARWRRRAAARRPRSVPLRRSAGVRCDLFPARLRSPRRPACFTRACLAVGGPTGRVGCGARAHAMSTSGRASPVGCCARRAIASWMLVLARDAITWHVRLTLAAP